MGKTITYNGDNGLEIMQDLSIEISAIFDSFNSFDTFLGTPYEWELFDTWWSEDKWNMYLQKLVYYRQFIAEILIKTYFNHKELYNSFSDLNIEKLTKIKNTKLKAVPEDRKIILLVLSSSNHLLSTILLSTNQYDKHPETIEIPLQIIEKSIFVNETNLMKFQFLIKCIAETKGKFNRYHYEDIYHFMTGEGIMNGNKTSYIKYIKDNFNVELKEKFKHSKTTQENKDLFRGYIKTFK
jgi:hypothetical protein